MASFDNLLAEARAATFTGWDFSWLDARSSLAQDLPWSYTAEVTSRAGAAATMADLGTGGGELLARIWPRPARTVATESWPPNVGVAAARDPGRVLRRRAREHEPGGGRRPARPARTAAVRRRRVRPGDQQARVILW